MEIHILSKEIIKPSSPNDDHHPQIYKMSFIDQMAPPLYAPLIYFYPSKIADDAKETGEKLKKSLSEVLTIYYLFAGRYKKGDLFIECKDQGVEYTEARVSNVTVDSLINVPDEKMGLLEGLLPEVGPAGVETTPLVAIQVSYFDEGGFTIATRIIHTIVDAVTGAAFMNGWATACRTGVSSVVRPNFELGSFIPARVSEQSSEPKFKIDTNARFVTRSFMFNNSAISTLKKKATIEPKDDEDNINPLQIKRPPSRMLVVSAVIWRALIGVAEAKRGHLMPSVLIQTVNLRGKTNPPMPDNTWGNFFMPSTARFEPDKTKMELANLIELMRDSIKEDLANCSKVSLGSDEFFNLVTNSFKRLPLIREQEDLRVHSFTSWCNLPFFEADFGWGKPKWTSGVKLPLEMIKLTDTYSGDGSVEACISLKEDEMQLFEKDPYIVAYCMF